MGLSDDGDEEVFALKGLSESSDEEDDGMDEEEDGEDEEENTFDTKGRSPRDSAMQPCLARKRIKTG